jgi:choline dehydrogenase-like flavoprotein
VDGHLGFLRAKVLGGTSIVNQALLDRFDDDAWDDWRARSGVPYFTRDAMEADYRACEEGLCISKVPEEFRNRNSRIFTRAFDESGYGWKALDRAQRDCKLEKGTDCIRCLGGCPRDSKQSALVTTIQWGREKGLEVRSEFEARSIEHFEDSVRVHGVRRGVKIQVDARRAVLAAGAFGNSALLLNSGFGARLPALGTAFTCHPQFMTYALFEEPVDAHKGAFQAVKSEDPKLRKAGFKLENVYAPPISTAMLLPGYGRSHQEMMKKYRYYSSMEVALRDEPSGRIRVGKNGKLLVDKSLTDVDRAKARSGLELVRELFTKTEAKKIIPCEQSFGLHLMGGCPIGTDGARSVVNPDFQVHGLKNFYAADSSIFPAAPGINPSFTIMALSRRAARGMVKNA